MEITILLILLAILVAIYDIVMSMLGSIFADYVLNWKEKNSAFGSLLYL